MDIEGREWGEGVEKLLTSELWGTSFVVDHLWDQIVDL